MNYPMDPQTAPFNSELDSNSGFAYEWDALDKFLEWQQEQPEAISSPESLVSESHFKYEYPNPEDVTLKTSLDTHTRWGQLSPESLSPMSSFSPPHSMPEDFSFKEESLDHTTLPIPKLPQVGRPRSTPGPVSDPGSYKTPTHARRRNQNREAQRAFRARQRQHVEELAQENKDLMTRNRELEERCEKLARAYERVLSDRMDSSSIRLATSSGAFGMPWNMVSSNLYKKDQE